MFKTTFPTSRSVLAASAAGAAIAVALAVLGSKAISTQDDDLDTADAHIATSQRLLLK